MNGIVGTVKSIEAHRGEVTTDFGATAAFDPRMFTAWGLGYCGTVYRSQGRTQLRVFALFDPFAWNARSAYVAMTRHKAEVRLYASQDIASDEPTLARLMSRVHQTVLPKDVPQRRHYGRLDAATFVRSRAQNLRRLASLAARPPPAQALCVA